MTKRPGSTELVTPDCPAAMAPRPIVMCPWTPTCPPSVTRSSSVALPAMPTCAASSASRPMRTLCPICTRLSILVPAPIRVSPTVGAIDGRVRADLDVVLEHDRADLRHLVVPPIRSGREAEAVAADDRAVLHDHAIAR